jgi:diaminopimelate epimerase
MKLAFTKMQGLGNDFVMLDAVRQSVNLSTEEIRAIADRRFGIGCDQILLVHPARTPQQDFRYQIFNADGSEVENCGNGARCFARFVLDQGLTHHKQIKVETLGGLMTLHCLEDGRVTVDMGIPGTEPKDLPMISDVAGPFQHLSLMQGKKEITIISMGNPHAVQRVAHLEEAPVTAEGPLIEHHSAFPKRVNAGFMEIIDRNTIHLRVWERGAGETLACGTGACAAVASGILRGWLDDQVEVHTRGGNLTIEWQGLGHHLMMTGDAKTSFTGHMDPSELTRNRP